MLPWIIILAVALVIFLLLQVRLGAEVEYGEEGFRAWVKLLGKAILLFPKPQKTRTQQEKERLKAEKKAAKKARKAAKKEEKQRRKAEKEKKKPDEEKPEEPEKKGGKAELILALLPVAVQALGALKKRIRIDPLRVRYTAGCPDAADTALLYAKASGGAGVVVALLEEGFDVRRREVSVEMDFLAGHSTIYLRAGVSIKVGQVLYLAIRYGIACIKVYMKKQREKAERENSAQSRKKSAKKETNSDNEGGA